MKRNIVLAFIACFSLFLAGLIYLCYRPHTILLFRWLDYFSFNYSIFQNIGIKLPAFFIYNFTNALFLIFGYIIIFIIWNKNKIYFLFYISFITFLNIIYEIITHDIEDIILICITFIICLILYFKYIGIKHEV